MSTLSAQAVKYDLNPDGSVNYTSVTLDPGGSAAQIHNVAAGTASTDAVNVSQLSTAVSGSKTHYYSVNDNGTQGSNYNNDGATGVNALAAGVGASAAGVNATAIGNGAQALGASTVALGDSNTAAAAAGQGAF
ncbi:hypothetical protein WK63_15060, partial [Burkholderia ubonensis]